MDKPLRGCLRPGCPETQRGALYCERHRPASTKSEKGYDAEWEELSAWWLIRHSKCVRCGRKAAIVDHRIPIRAGGARLDKRNLRSLCRKCHGRITWYANIDAATLHHRFHRRYTMS